MSPNLNALDTLKTRRSQIGKRMPTEKPTMSVIESSVESINGGNRVLHTTESQKRLSSVSINALEVSQLKL